MTKLLVPAVLVAGLFAGIFASGCGDDDDSHEVGGLVHDVHVHLDEWSLETEPTTIDGGGTITIGGHNHGSLPHQVTVIKTDLDAADLPLDRVSVDIAAAGEEVFSIEVPPADGDEGLQVGITDLDVGKYAFICNIPGHYQQGMYASVEVTAAP